jgi:hypothetical protein
MNPTKTWDELMCPGIINVLHVPRRKSLEVIRMRKSKDRKYKCPKKMKNK